MASSGSLHPTLLVLLLLTVAATASTTTTFVRAGAPPADLAERLQGVGQQQCWEILMDIRSCTGEIILFFLNGEAYLGPGCCRAIRIIERRCWAADLMLSVIGFTPEEGDMLKAYCDAGDDDNDGGEGRHHGGGGLSPAPPPHRALDGVASGGTALPVAGMVN